MGGTLTVQLGVMLPTSVRSACRVGTGRGGAFSWCTLLGPEGPGFLPGVGCIGAGNGGGVIWTVGGGWAYGSFVGPHDVRPFGLGECGADRMLRTTQWTRASLDSRHPRPVGRPCGGLVCFGGVGSQF